jgi:hypothetical protein
MYGWKVLLCFAIRQAKQPTDHENGGEQEQADYDHMSSSQMD